MQVSLAKMILPILIKFEHFQCIFIGCQVKQAAVEQIRCARQASEEACWQCGRPATETCSGISQKQKTNSKTKKKTQKYQFEHFFLVFSELLQTHHTYQNQRTTNTKPIEMMTMMMYEHCAGCSLARYCGQLCQHKVETKADFRF